MLWRRRHSALTWSLTGIFLSVMLSGQAAHRRFPGAGQAGSGCQGCASHASGQQQAAKTTHDRPAATIQRGNRSCHDHARCVICQFFAASKALPIATAPPHRAAANRPHSLGTGEQPVRTTSRAHAARAPPRPHSVA